MPSSSNDSRVEILNSSNNLEEGNNEPVEQWAKPYDPKKLYKSSSVGMMASSNSMDEKRVPPFKRSNTALNNTITSSSGVNLSEDKDQQHNFRVKEKDLSIEQARERRGFLESFKRVVSGKKVKASSFFLKRKEMDPELMSASELRVKIHELRSKKHLKKDEKEELEMYCEALKEKLESTQN